VNIWADTDTARRADARAGRAATLEEENLEAVREAISQCNARGLRNTKEPATPFVVQLKLQTETENNWGGDDI
jgi:hypothetical protein